MKKQHILMLSLVLLILVLIISAGYLYYRYEKNAIRQEKYMDLKMIADLKMEQIVHWREERLANAENLVKSPFFRQKILDWVLFKDMTIETDLLKRLLLTKLQYDFEDIFIVSSEGELLLGHDTALINIDTVTFDLCGKALLDGKIFISEPYFCPSHNTIHLDIIAPVQNDKNVPVVVLVLRINPSDFLYPYIQSWPTSSKTAETLILRKDGDSILYVNELRHTSNTALNLRIPLSRIEVPAVQAVLGHEGIWEGPDYRGVGVLAYIRPVPGTSWFMVAKVDKDEIYAELKYRTVIIIIIALLLFLFSGIGISWLYNNRQKNIYRKLLETGTALQDSQEEFRITLYSIGDAVITTDINGCIRNMNVVAEKLTGWLEPDAAGRTIGEVFDIIKEESRIKVESPVQRVLNEGLVIGLANHTLLISKDGKETPIADSGAPIRNEKGDITGVVLVFRDQTQERMAQKALQESERKFRETVKYLDEGYYCVTTDGILLDHNRKFNQILGFDTSKDMKGLKLPDFWQDPDERKAYLQELVTSGFIRNYLINAKKSGGEKIVVMANSHLAKDENNNLLRIEGTFTDFTDLKRAEEALALSEQFLYNIFEQGSVSMWISDREGTLVKMNQACRELFAVTEAEVVGKYNILTDNLVEAQGYMPLVRDVFEKGTIARFTLDYDARDVKHIDVKKGRRRILDVAVSPIRDVQGNITNAIVQHRDITELRQAEIALHDSEEKYSKAFQTSHYAITITHAEDGRFIEVNDAFTSIAGYTQEEALSDSSVGLKLWANEKDRESVVADLRAGQVVEGREYQFRTKSGKTITGLFSARIIKLSNRPFILSSINDITGRKQAEDALRRSEKDLKESQRIAHVGSWRLDVATNQVFWTEELYNMYGFDPSLPPPPYTEHMKLFTPESWERLSVALAHTRETGIPYTLELEIVRKDGSNGWMWVRGETDVDPAGKIVGLWGAVQDITGRKQAEEALKEQRDFSENLIETAQTIILVLDTQGRIVRFNPYMEKLSGYSLDEVRGKDWFGIFLTPELSLTIKPIFEKTVDDIDTSGNVNPIITKDGRMILVEWNNKTLKDKDGRTVGILSIGQDITERVLAEKELEQHRNQLEQLVAERTTDLKKSEEKFRTVADFAYDWEYWIDADNRMLYVSPSCESITGFLPVSFYKDPQFIDTIVHPDDRQVFEKHIKSFYGGNGKGEKSDLEFRIITKNGCTKWIGHSCTPVTGDNGVYMGRRASNRDMTESKKAEIFMRCQRDIAIALGGKMLLNEAFASVLEAAIEVSGMDCGGVYLLDEKSGAIDLVHYSGFPADFVAVSSHYGAESPNHQLVMRGEPVYASMPALKINKHEPEQLRAIAIIPMLASGKVIGCINVASHTADAVPADVRNGLEVLVNQASAALARIKAENEISELNEALTERSTELEVSNKELEAFSYSVSHDLRAPLRHVSGYVELLKKRFHAELPEKGQHYLNSIADSVHIMGALIDDLLQFSRTGRMEMRQSDCDMDEIVKEVIESLRKDNPDRKIEWIVGKLASIKGDKSMLGLVWINLLSNAVKFTRPRKKARIEIGVLKERKETVFYVRDNGVGFDMQYAQKLFGVFQRLHPAEEFEGTGIGLANVQRIVLRHGGRAWAEAESDKGAVFYFSIPNRQ